MQSIVTRTLRSLRRDPSQVLRIVWTGPLPATLEAEHLGVLAGRAGLLAHPAGAALESAVKEAAEVLLPLPIAHDELEERSVHVVKEGGVCSIVGDELDCSGLAEEDDMEIALEAVFRAIIPCLGSVNPMVRCLRRDAVPEAFGFAAFWIPPSTVFARSRHARAFVNLKPILPGHVLVCPARPCPRLKGLTDEETADLFGLVRQVASLVERAHEASAVQVAVQDGPAAGQTVPHVHVHVVPRRTGDLPASDDVYRLLDASSKWVTQAVEGGWGGDAGRVRAAWEGLGGETEASTSLDPGERKPRPLEEMNREAEWYRSLG
jgi:bis(5'-adenosyl)-triphosphatase